MGEFLFAVVAAFLIFMVLLPAVGVLAGIFIRAGLPYAAGFWVCSVAVWLFAGGAFNTWLASMLSVVWALSVWFARRKYQEQKGVRFEWCEGHYTGALICLMFFAPLRKPAEVDARRGLKECQAEA